MITLTNHVISKTIFKLFNYLYFLKKNIIDLYIYHDVTIISNCRSNDRLQTISIKSSAVILYNITINFHPNSISKTSSLQEFLSDISLYQFRSFLDQHENFLNLLHNWDKHIKNVYHLSH